MTSWRAVVRTVGLTLGVCLASVAVAAAQDLPLPGDLTESLTNDLPGVKDALLRLPVACALGAMLALRPKRRGTPTRTPAVVQTQIILAVVGSLIMLIVGSNLARAFGIVGAANLIRYRAKIEDPKDAGVMLSTLAVGLAAGVGHLALAGVAAVFLLVALWVIESFEPNVTKEFELSVGAEGNAEDLRGRIESVLERYHLRYELRTTSAEKVIYAVKVPYGVETETVTEALLRLESAEPLAVAWNERAKPGK